MYSRERNRIRDDIVAAVAKRWPELEFTQLRGSRYCFTRQVIDEPLPHYEHLLIHHRRRQDLLEGRWSYSLFPVYSVSGVPAAFQVESSNVRRPVETRHHHLLDELTSFHNNEAPALLERLKSDHSAHLAIWSAYRGLDMSEYTLPYRVAACTLAAIRGFSMSEPTALRMRSFLKEYVPEGAPKEVSSFTLEASKAREKLGEFLLQEPQHFFLHAIAGAVAGGAPEVNLYVDSDDIVVKFGGEKLASHHLEDLFSSLLAGRASSREREFAVALNAALSLRPSLLSFDSWHDGKGVRLTFEEGKEEVVQLSEGTPGHRLWIRRRASLEVAKRFLTGWKGRPEYLLAAERFRYAPVPITVADGEDLRTLPQTGVLQGLVFEHPDHALPTLPIPTHLLKRAASPVDASVIILFGPEPGLHWMVHGMTYDPPADFSTSGMWVLVSDDKASRDLSFSKIVKGRRGWEVAEAMTRQCDDFLQTQLRRYAAASIEEQREWLSALQGLYLKGVKIPLQTPMVEVVAGGLIGIGALINRKEIAFTEANFPYPLETGEEVFVLCSKLRGRLGAKKFVDKTDDLLAIERYHQKRTAWLKETPTVELHTRTGERFSRPLSRGNRLLSLRENAHWACRFEYLLEGRPLAVEHLKGFPEGLLVVADSRNFRRDIRWQKLRHDDAVTALQKEVQEELADFYHTVMREGPSLAEYALSYLLYLKRQGGNWRSYLDDVTFPAPSGKSASLRTALADTAWDELAPSARDLSEPPAVSIERRKRVLKGLLSKLSLPVRVLLRLRELKE